MRMLIFIATTIIVLFAGCSDATSKRQSDYSEPQKQTVAPTAEDAADAIPKLTENFVQLTPVEESRFLQARQLMVKKQLRGRDITDSKVLDAMGRVARHHFVPEYLRDFAYVDRPLSIGLNQTISQPYIVALMTQTARPTSESRSLEIGTGSGYQAAVLAELCEEVYSIEILESLAKSARERLDALGYNNVIVRHGDGYQGWREHAPFDVILVTAAPDHVPQALVDQLAIGGRMVIPVGRFFQELLLLEKQSDGTVHRNMIAPVRFVPMTGEAQRKLK